MSIIGCLRDTWQVGGIRRDVSGHPADAYFAEVFRYDDEAVEFRHSIYSIAHFQTIAVFFKEFGGLDRARVITGRPCIDGDE